MEFEGDHPDDDQERGGGGGSAKLLIILGVVGGLCLCCCAGSLGAVYYLGQEMLGPLVEFGEKLAQAEKENPWAPSEDSRIEAERFEVYLTARRQAVEAFRESATKVKEVEEREDAGVGDAFNVVGGIFSAMKAWPDALVEHGMNPGEFRWITEQAYVVWLGGQPDSSAEIQGYNQLPRSVFLGKEVPTENQALFAANKAVIEELMMVEFDSMISNNNEVR